MMTVADWLARAAVCCTVLRAEAKGGTRVALSAVVTGCVAGTAPLEAMGGHWLGAAACGAAAVVWTWFGWQDWRKWRRRRIP